jgi:50S ribosomal protein L16 3-hydroxylase
MLYLPPGLAHWGIAEGPCMTWSVGFRAPSAAEIVQDVAAEAAERLPEDRRFADPGMAWPRDGEIPAAAIAQLRGLLQEALDDDALLAQWFACYMTGRKYPDLDITPPRRPSGGINALLARGLGVERHPASRFAWLRGRPARLFVDGESMSCPTALARVLCSQAPLTAAQLGAFAAKPETRAVLDRLLASGALRRAE